MKDEPFAVPLARFRAILKKYEKRCVVDTDSAVEYHLNFKPETAGAKPRFFAGTGINKQTISFYLKPIDDSPTLRGQVSPALGKHLSGKCCFRFKTTESIPFDELAELTKRGFSQRNGNVGRRS